MQFVIPSNQVYRVELADEPIIGDDGEPCWGEIDYTIRLIRISPTCPVQSRRSTLLHELRHAWRFHLPMPLDDEEADANYYALMTDAIVEQLDRQGGSAALIGLGLKDSWVEFDPRALGRSLAEVDRNRQMACAYCRQPVSPGNVEAVGPQRHPKLAAPVMHLAFFCPHCDHVQHWCEFTNAAGRPTGACAVEPEVFGGAEAIAFCEAHPDKTTFFPAA